MEKEYQMGTLAGLRLSFNSLFIPGTILLWILLSGIGILVLDLRFSQAVTVGLVSALLYWLSEIVHQLGHAYAARRTGYPMVGIRLGTYLFFSTSLYPEHEEPLHAEIHIRRALGGPMISLGVTVLTGLCALMLYPLKGIIWWIALFACSINLLVFTLGSLLPLGFTDGSTLLKWWGKR